MRKTLKKIILSLVVMVLVAGGSQPTHAQEVQEVHEVQEAQTDTRKAISPGESENIQSEANAIAFLMGRGFKNLTVTADRTIDGQPLENYEVTLASQDKHPVYYLSYTTEEGDQWTIMVINGSIYAEPVTYNEADESGKKTILTEKETVTVYDSEKNEYIEGTPTEEDGSYRLSETINKDLIDSMNSETISSLEIISTPVTEITTAAADLKSSIYTLQPAEDLTLEDKSTVERCRAEYEALTSDEKQSIADVYQILTDAEERMEFLKGTEYYSYTFDVKANTSYEMRVSFGQQDGSGYVLPTLKLITPSGKEKAYDTVDTSITEEYIKAQIEREGNNTIIFNIESMEEGDWILKSSYPISFEIEVPGEVESTETGTDNNQLFTIVKELLPLILFIAGFIVVMILIKRPPKKETIKEEEKTHVMTSEEEFEKMKNDFFKENDYSDAKYEMAKKLEKEQKKEEKEEPKEIDYATDETVEEYTDHFERESKEKEQVNKISINRYDDM